MDYAYFGPVNTWPLASTLASITGLLLIFGEQVGRAGQYLARHEISDLATRVYHRHGAIWICLGLLAALWVGRDSPGLSILQGLPRLDSEIARARTDGYYEALNRSTGSRKSEGLAERPAGRKSFTESGLVDEVADYRRRVLRPNLDATWNGTRFRTDAQGHRGPSRPLEKPPGTLRIAVLGSSNTMGHGVEDEETYARRLEHWLNLKAGQVRGRRVEVVNLAVSGDAPSQQLYRLQHDVESSQPDWILCDITALGFSLEEQHLRWVVEHQPAIPFDFVKTAIDSSGISQQDSTDAIHQKLIPYLRPMLDRTIEGWAVASRRLGVPLTVVILPRADSKTESPGLFQYFRDLSKRHGLRFADLSDTFDAYDLDEYRIAPWDHHPNALGHRLIFERLRDELIEDSTFRALIHKKSER